jgi:hypothetical protein
MGFDKLVNQKESNYIKSDSFWFTKEQEGLTGGTESAAAREGLEAKDWVGGMPEGRGGRLGGSNSSGNGGRLRRCGLWAKRFL